MGWTYNTADSVANDGPLITGVAIALTATSLSVLLLRLYVRLWMIKATGAGMSHRFLIFQSLTIDCRISDDYVLIFTWVRS